MWPTYINFKDDKGFPDATTRVIKLAAGSDTAVVLPQFVHAGLMADSAGAVWVKDAGNDRLVKLAAGSDRETQQPLPSAGAAMSWRGGLTPSGRRDWPRAASPRSPLAACSMRMSCVSEMGVRSRLLEFPLPVSTVGT